MLVLVVVTVNINLHQFRSLNCSSRPHTAEETLGDRLARAVGRGVARRLCLANNWREWPGGRYCGGWWKLLSSRILQHSLSSMQIKPEILSLPLGPQRSTKETQKVDCPWDNGGEIVNQLFHLSFYRWLWKQIYSFYPILRQTISNAITEVHYLNVTFSSTNFFPGASSYTWNIDLCYKLLVKRTSIWHLKYNWLWVWRD